MSGTGLDQVLARLPNGLPLPVACWLVARVAHALAKNARPLTPADVRIDERGEANVVTSREAPPSAYRAPETIDATNVDEPALVFVLGAILFECLSGRSAFARKSEDDTRRALRDEPLPALAGRVDGATHELDAILQRAAAKMPASRFASTAELAARLESFLADELHEVGPVELAAVVRAAMQGQDAKGALFASGFAPMRHAASIAEPRLAVPANAPETEPPRFARMAQSSEPVMGHAQLTPAPVGVAASSVKKSPSYEWAELDLGPRAAPAAKQHDRDLEHANHARTPEPAKAHSSRPPQNQPATKPPSSRPPSKQPLALDEETLLRARARRASDRAPALDETEQPNWILRIVVLLVALLCTALAYQFVLRPFLRE